MIQDFQHFTYERQKLHTKLCSITNEKEQNWKLIDRRSRIKISIDLNIEKEISVFEFAKILSFTISTWFNFMNNVNILKATTTDIKKGVIEEIEKWQAINNTRGYLELFHRFLSRTCHKNSTNHSKEKEKRRQVSLTESAGIY